MLSAIIVLIDRSTVVACEEPAIPAGWLTIPGGQDIQAKFDGTEPGLRRLAHRLLTRLQAAVDHLLA